MSMSMRLYSGSREKAWLYEAWRTYRKQCFCKGPTLPPPKPCRRTSLTCPGRKCRRTLSGALQRLFALQGAINTTCYPDRTGNLEHALANAGQYTAHSTLANPRASVSGWGGREVGRSGGHICVGAQEQHIGHRDLVLLFSEISAVLTR